MNRKSILTGTLVALIGASSIATPSYSQTIEPAISATTVEQRYDTPETNPLIKALKDYSEGKSRPYKPHPMEAELNRYEKANGLETKIDKLAKHDGKTLTSGTAGKLTITGLVLTAYRNAALERAAISTGRDRETALEEAAGYNQGLRHIDYQLTHSKIVVGE